MSRPLAFVALALLAAASGSAALAVPRVPCGDSYRVMRHDTMYSIARRCATSVAAIAAASGLSDPARIAVGQRLVIRQVSAPKPDEQAADEPGYRFERGDTLYSLARWARVSLRALLAANPGIGPRKIEIGDMVRLPVGAVRPESARLRERERPRAQAPQPPRDADDDDEAPKPDEESEREAEPEGM